MEFGKKSAMKSNVERA